jgi:hypothetical protein
MALTAPATTAGIDGTAAATGGKRTARRNARIRGADDMAVASFVLGLPGLLVANVLFGPTAIVLAAMALWRGTARRGRRPVRHGTGLRRPRRPGHPGHRRRHGVLELLAQAGVRNP